MSNRKYTFYLIRGQEITIIASSDKEHKQSIKTATKEGVLCLTDNNTGAILTIKLDRVAAFLCEDVK